MKTGNGVDVGPRGVVGTGVGVIVGVAVGRGVDVGTGTGVGVGAWTMIVPSMLIWNLQKYGNVPGVLKVCPGDDEPELTTWSQSQGKGRRSPSVAVWELLPSFLQVIVSPAVMGMVTGSKKLSRMITVTGAARTSGAPLGTIVATRTRAPRDTTTTAERNA